MNLNMGVNFYDDMAAMPAYPPRPSELLAGHPSLPPLPMMHRAVTGTSASLDPRPLTTAALIDPPMPPLPLPPPPPRDPPGQPGLTAALRERIGLPLLAAGRRLPKPPFEGQRPMNIPVFPHRPLPHTQKPERLTTRNRRLPKIPNPLSGVEFKSGSTAAAAAAAANANSLTTSLFGFAKKLTTAGGTPLSHHPPASFGQQRQDVAGLKNSQSVSGGLSARQAAQSRPPGRGAKLPSVPKIGAPHRRRQLPDRGALYSRSLEGISSDGYLLMALTSK